MPSLQKVNLEVLHQLPVSQVVSNQYTPSPSGTKWHGRWQLLPTKGSLCTSGFVCPLRLINSPERCRGWKAPPCQPQLYLPADTHTLLASICSSPFHNDLETVNVVVICETKLILKKFVVASSSFGLCNILLPRYLLFLSQYLSNGTTVSSLHFHKLPLTFLDPSAKSIYCFAYELRSQTTCKNEVKYLTCLLDSQVYRLELCQNCS